MISTVSKMKPEEYIEKAVCAFAESKGFEVRKLEYVNKQGAPDRMFYGYGVVFFIEFKRPGGNLRPAQVRELRTMINHNIQSFVVDDLDMGKRVIECFIDIIEEKS